MRADNVGLYSNALSNSVIERAPDKDIHSLFVMFPDMLLPCRLKGFLSVPVTRFGADLPPDFETVCPNSVLDVAGQTALFRHGSALSLELRGLDGFGVMCP